MIKDLCCDDSLNNWSTISSDDTEISIYGNNSNSTITKEFMNTVNTNIPLLNTIYIQSSITDLGVGCFNQCTNLIHIYIDEGVNITNIPDEFASNLKKLKNVGILYKENGITEDDIIEFPNSIISIGNNAFQNCESLGTKIYIHDNIKSIGDYVFDNTSINNINLGIGLANTKSSDDNTDEPQTPPINNDVFDDTGYDVNRTIKTPCTLYLTSKRQFRYKRIQFEEPLASGDIYTFKDDDGFKYCTDPSHLMIFKQGLLLPPNSYLLHTIANTPISDVGIVFNTNILAGEKIDIFYVTNDLKNIATDYYINKTERYIQNGMIIHSNNDNECRVMGEQIYENDDRRTNYIKLRSPLYAISSKHSVFVFLNGKKVRFDELEDISDTIISINTDYSNRNDMDANRLEVYNHLDTQDIIEQLYINDGLNHIQETAQNQFIDTQNPNVYKNTRLIYSFRLSDLEAYSKRTLLDDILYDLSPENLNKLFYNYDEATGPMTHYRELNFREPDFLDKDKIIEKIIEKYYSNVPSNEDENLFIWDTKPESHSNTVFYIGKKNSVKVPVTHDEEEVKALYGTTFNRNAFLKEVIIQDGVERID